MDAEFVFPLSDQPLDFIDVQMCASFHWLLSLRADVHFTRTLCGEPVEPPFPLRRNCGILALIREGTPIQRRVIA